MMGSDLKLLRARVKRAELKRAQWEPLFRELNEYVLPYRTAGDSASEGQKYTDKVFDSTAIDGAFRFAGRLQQDLLPPFQDFFELRVGDALRSSNKEQAKRLDEQLDVITKQVRAALATSTFHTSSHECFLDLFGGTGAMLMREGDDHEIVETSAAPINEIVLENGPYGKLWGRHWIKTWQASQVAAMWSRGKLSDGLRDAAKSEADKPVKIVQACNWDPSDKRWKMVVYADCGDEKIDGDDAIFREQFRTSPWITPRFFVVPGEPYGRGPGMLALPAIKTVNKSIELELKAAALALSGVWTARDDDVFNPETARFEPGSIIKVESNGGVFGKTLERLDVPGDFNLSRLIVEDQRQQITKMTFNQRLPDPAGSVRSPTEILERVRELDIDMAGVFGRLTLEIVRPVVQRTLEILYNKRLIPADLTIDQLSVGLEVVSPVASAQRAAKAKPIVDYATLAQTLHGPEKLRHFLRESATTEIGRMLGVSEGMIPSDNERNLMKQEEAQAAQQAAEAEAAAKAPPPPPSALANGRPI